MPTQYRPNLLPISTFTNRTAHTWLALSYCETEQTALIDTSGSTFKQTHIPGFDEETETLNVASVPGYLVQITPQVHKHIASSLSYILPDSAIRQIVRASADCQSWRKKICVKKEDLYLGKRDHIGFKAMLDLSARMLHNSCWGGGGGGFWPLKGGKPPW